MDAAKQKQRGLLNAFSLHLVAMALMLCDHLWATVLQVNILTWIGRLAFPIFAFMIVEGYFHTQNLKKYVLRLLIFALISEVPYDLMYENTWFYPFGQNVLWTFLLGLACIHLIEKARKKGKWWLTLLVAASVMFVGFWLGALTMVDYHGEGVLMVIGFYIFRGRRWYEMLGQALMLYYVNFEMIKGLNVPIELFGRSIEIHQQGLAILALIPIWLYNGRQGPRNKVIKYAFYLFYPIHMLILGLIIKLI